MLPAAAFAADAQSVTTIRAAYFHILYNGTEQAFTDVNGAAVLPLVYEGTTYLPIRALSNLAGLKVECIGETGTVKLASGGTQTTYSGTPKGITENVNVIVSSNITFTLDSTVKTFRNVNGKAVYPLNCNGTTTSLFAQFVAWLTFLLLRTEQQAQFNLALNLLMPGRHP